MADLNTAQGNQVYSNAAVTALDIDKPEIFNKMIYPHADQFRAYLNVRNMGFETPTTNEEYSWFEKDDTWSYITLGTGGVTGGATTEADIAVDQDTDDKFFVRKKDIIMFPRTAGSSGAGVKAVVTDTDETAGTIDIASIDGSTNLPSADADDVLIIISNVSGEGSNSRDPLFTKATKYTANLQIFKEAISATGTSMTDESWVEINPNDGLISGLGSTVYYNEAFDDATFAMLTALDGAFWFGKEADAVADPESEIGANHITTQGLFEEVGDRGSDFAYTTASTVETFDTAGQALVSEFVDTRVPIWTPVGAVNYGVWENIFFDEFTSNDQMYVSKSVNEALYGTDDLGINIGYSYIKKWGYMYQFDVQRNWSNKNTYGASGYDFDKSGFFIPAGMTKDEYSGVSYGNIGLRYKSYGQFNRRMIMGSLAGFGTVAPSEVPVNDIDLRKEMWLAHQGNQFMCVNKFIEMYDPTT